MITIVMGKPGGGKSTFLAYLAKQYLDRGENVYSTQHILGCQKIDKSNLGTILLENGLAIIDESGMEFNSREFKKFTSDLYFFFTWHRHYNLNVVLAVQFWDRLDIVIRELVQRIVIVKPCLFQRFFIKTKDVGCDIGISEDEQIVERYFYLNPLFSIRYYWRKPLMKMFDSYCRKPLPRIWLPLWGEYRVKPKIRHRVRAFVTANICRLISVLQGKRSGRVADHAITRMSQNRIFRVIKYRFRKIYSRVRKLRKSCKMRFSKILWRVAKR